MEMTYMKLFGPSASDTILSKEEFMKEGMAEIIGRRNASGIPTSKSDMKRLRWSLRVDWKLNKT